MEGIKFIPSRHMVNYIIFLFIVFKKAFPMTLDSEGPNFLIKKYMTLKLFYINT